MTLVSGQETAKIRALAQGLCRRVVWLLDVTTLKLQQTCFKAYFERFTTDS